MDLCVESMVDLKDYSGHRLREFLSFQADKTKQSIYVQQSKSTFYKAILKMEAAQTKASKLDFGSVPHLAEF